MMRRVSIATAALALALTTTGCSRSPRVNFYVMEPAATESSALAPAAPGPSAPRSEASGVVVGPVTLPELVDRPQLVVRVDANRVDILEAQRWAEPLKTALPRLIAQNLGRQLGSNRVSSYHDVTGAPADYRVLVDLLRFDSVPGNAVIVEAKWSIRGGGAGGVRTGHSLIQEKITGSGYEAIVASYSRALAGVSADIAAGLRGQQPPQH